MLIDIEKDRPITVVPYQREFEVLKRRLTKSEFAAMIDRINTLIDESGAEIATAGWLPGADWRGTVFQPIYEKVAPGNFDRSAMFFGQLVWFAVMNRSERWASGKYQVDGRDIGSRTYFRLTK